MSLLRELILLSRSGLDRCSHHRLIPCLQTLMHQNFQLQQKAGFKNQTNRFKLPPVPKEKEKKIYKKKKSLDNASSSIPTHLISTSPSPDDVWSRRYFPTPEFPFLEAINKHREYAHPAMTDNADGVVFLDVLLDLTTNKKTKFLPPPSGLVLLPNNFDNFFPNRVIVIVKGNDDQATAEKAGAIFIGGQEMVKKLEKGEIKAEDYDHVVMGECMLVESSVIKKLLKDHFPSRKNGNLGTDMDYMVRLFRVGKEYQANRHSDEEASMTFAFGKLNMTDEELVENIRSILQAVISIKPNGRLLKSLSIACPPSKEAFLVHLDDTIMPARVVDGGRGRKGKGVGESGGEAVVLEASGG